MSCYLIKGMTDSDFDRISADCAGIFSRGELVRQRGMGYFPAAYVVADSNGSYLVRIPHFEKKETSVLYFYRSDDLKLKLRLDSIWSSDIEIVSGENPRKLTIAEIEPSLREAFKSHGISAHLDCKDDFVGDLNFVWSNA